MGASPRKPWWRRWFGSRSERAAARFLKKLGCKVLTRNFSCHLGELDLVVLDGGCIVFVEVRSTEERDEIEPAASVDRAKQRRLTRLAEFFLHKKRLENRMARFDVLIVRWPAGQAPVIQHFRNAFDAID
jgi:putative endonuclease